MSGEDDFKDKREKFSVQIRRANREEILMKRRNIQSIETMQETTQQKPVMIVDQRFKNQIQQFINFQYNESMFQDLANCINSPDVLQQHRGVIGMRKLLAKNVQPPIKRFIDKGLTNKCLWMAKQKQFPQIKLQSTWILTNVASGESKFCQKLIQRGGIDLFVGLLQQNLKGVVDQAIWGIGNLAADKPKHRDAILKKGGMQALIKIVQTSQDKLQIRNGSWAITNLCRGQPPPEQKYIKQACPLLCKVIKSGALKGTNNKQILSDIIWTISHMTEGSKSRIQRVNKAEILGQIFQYVLDPYKDLYIPALKILGNFSNGNENHTQQLIKHGIFDLALKILQHPKKSMRRQMCWILSNIAAGVQSQVSIFMARTDLLDKIAYLFKQDAVEVKRQICWIYGNFGHLGDRQKLIQIMLYYDTMRIYVHLLYEQDPETLQNVLETLFKVLFVGKKCEINNQNLMLNKFLEYGGASQLQSLQMHENRNVYERVVKIMTKFFELEQNTL